MSGDGDSWKCTVCTYSNTGRMNRCVMCNAERPSTGNKESGRTSPFSLARSTSEGPHDAEGDLPKSKSGSNFGPGSKRAAKPAPVYSRSTFEMENSAVHSRAEPVTRPAQGMPRRCPTRTDIVDWVRELSTGGKIALVCVIGALLMTAGFLIGFAYRKVDDMEYGLRQSPGGHVESQPYDTGYYYVGLGSDFVTFSKRFNEIQFSLGGGNRVLTVRALDGQLVQTDIVIKYRFSFETLYDMFMNYGTSVHDVITRLSRSRLRDVAAQYRSEDFFSRRIEIEEHMRQALVPEFSDRYVTLVALALQRIRLPDDLEEVIESIEISKLDAKLQSEQIIKFREQSITDVMLTKMEAQLEFEKTSYKQETSNIVRGIEREEVEVEEITKREIAELQADLDNTLATYNQNTENGRLKIDGKREVEVEKTQQQVQLIDADIGLANAKSDGVVSRVKAQSDASVAATLANAQAAVAKAKSDAQAARLTKLSGMGFTASNINAIEWAEAVATHPADKVHMDIQTPSSLQLQGTTETMDHAFKGGSSN